LPNHTHKIAGNHPHARAITGPTIGAAPAIEAK